MTCVFGIKYIGWTNTVLGVCATVFSIVFGYITKYIEQSTVIVLILMISISNVVFMLYWTPNTSDLYAIFVMSVAFGTTKSYTVGQIRGLKY